MKYEDYILIFMLIFTIGVVFSKELIMSLIFLSLFSLFLAIKYFFLHAPDVAITEAALGAGLTTVIFLITIKKTKKNNFKMLKKEMHND